MEEASGFRGLDVWLGVSAGSFAGRARGVPTRRGLGDATRGWNGHVGRLRRARTRHQTADEREEEPTTSPERGHKDLRKAASAARSSAGTKRVRPIVLEPSPSSSSSVAYRPS
jgi:hypothetical protein